MIYRLNLISGRVIVPGHAGFHRNIPESLMTPALEPFRVRPADPAEVLAGIETAFLRFDSEAQEADALAEWVVADAPP